MQALTFAKFSYDDFVLASNIFFCYSTDKNVKMFAWLSHCEESFLTSGFSAQIKRDCDVMPWNSGPHLDIKTLFSGIGFPK